MKGKKKKFLRQIVTFALNLCLIIGLMQSMETKATPANVSNQTFCAGTYFSAFIKEDNSLWTCGGSGGIGKSYIMSEEWMAGNWLQESGGVPVKVMDNVKSVYSNGDMTCYAVTLDNSLWAFGENGGAFGDGTLQSSRTPVKIMDDVVYVESLKYTWDERPADGSFLNYHGYAVIALKSDGTLWSWGTNHWGEVGDGTKETRLMPVKIMDNVVCAINSECLKGMTAEVVSAYAVKTDGSLWAWGANHAGQLGNGTCDDRAAPVRITDNVRTVKASDGACCITKQDGSCWMWGSDFSHTVGAQINYIAIRSPRKIADSVISATAGSTDKYLIKEDSSLWAWGKAPRLDLRGSGQSFDSAAPVPIMNNVRDIHDGRFTTFVIQTDNVLWGWGLNYDGEIGIGYTSDYQTNPTVVMDQVLAVYTTSFSTYILRTDGTLWGCGSDSYCQFGQGGDGTRRATPVKIADHVRLY